MREILCRAKAAITGGWIYGWYWKNGMNKCFIRSLKTVNGERVIADRRIDPETVGEYTGIRDKNRERIFEGDIVKTDDILHDNEIQISGKKQAVRKYRGCWVIASKHLDEWDFLYSYCGELEVIGNIYDNPGLLEE